MSISDGMSSSEPATDITRPMTVSDRTFQALTTEHFGLAGARAQATNEGAARSALYLGALSSTLIALGLTAQVGKGGSVFRIFALVALPTLFIFGLFTFVRLVQLGTEDFLLGRAINRIRHLYLDEASDGRTYFLLTGWDDHYGVMRNMGLAGVSQWQLFFTAAMSIAVVNGVVGGSAAAVASTILAGASLTASVVVGTVVAIVAFMLHLRFQSSSHLAGDESEIAFPSPPATEEPDLRDSIGST